MAFQQTKQYVERATGGSGDAGRATRRNLGIAGLLMMIISILVWFYISGKANEAKEAFTKAKQDDTAAGSGSENLDDVKQYIQIAAASVLPPDTADKAYSMISDNYWPTTLMSVLGFVVGLAFFLTYVLIGSKPGRGF
tara:strand:+ start:2021 stop:2434 length:414 start_codon:yes stop_codon:yes gene_type:complete